jgi:hypothetical protein
MDLPFPPPTVQEHDLDSLLVDSSMSHVTNLLEERFEESHEPQHSYEEIATEPSVSSVCRNRRVRSSTTIGRDPVLLESPPNLSYFLSFTLPKMIDTSDAEPSLTLPQLIIMALVSTPSRTLSILQITAWIEDNFNFYKYLSIYQKSNSSTGEVDWIRRVPWFLKQYDFPTEPVCFNKDDEIQFRLEEGGKWFILHRPHAVESFPLMKLPLELRLIIYHWALSRPLPDKHGWVIDPDYTEHRVAKYNEYDHVPQYLSTPAPGGWELRTPRLDKVLALLSTSRQINVEATPVFYRSNSFYFDSCRTMHSFLSGLPNRFRFVRSIVLNYSPSNRGNHCNRAFTLLSQTKVRNIHLIMNERELLSRFLGLRTMGCLPGMKEFEKLRGLDNISFEGKIKQISEYLIAHGIEKVKKDDSSDGDDRAAAKLWQDQKGYLTGLKKAWRENIKRHKQAIRGQKEAEIQKEKQEKKRARAEAKEFKEAELKKEKEAKQTLSVKIDKAKKELINRRQREKQRAERVKATKLKAEALSKMKAKQKHLAAGKKAKRFVASPSSNPSEDGTDEDFETEIESEAEVERSLKKAKSILLPKRPTQAKKSIQLKKPTKTRTVVDISS